MKHLYTLIAVVLITTASFSQIPDKMNFQAVVRNATDGLVISSSVGMKISILQGSVSGSAAYVETQTPTTNANGLISIEIGGGSAVSGDFSTIDWANGPYFIKTETDPTGGINYTISGTTQLLSVPYALFSKTAENVTNDMVNDADADPTNELQTLSQSGNTITLSNGGGSVTITDTDTHLTEAQVDNYVSNNGYPTAVDNLRILQGTIGKDGTILSGTGFTVQKTAVGNFIITFNIAFANYPALSYSTNYIPVFVLSNVLSSSSVSVMIKDTNSNFVDPNVWFSFIAMGPK